MATSKKKPYYINLTTPTDALVLQLDPDIYDSEVQTQTGLSAVGTTFTKRIKTTVKQATASSFAGRIRLTVSKGANTPEEETRQVDIVCETSKLDTAKSGLINKTVKLGYGANAVEWTIVGAR